MNKLSKGLLALGSGATMLYAMAGTAMAADIPTAITPSGNIGGGFSFNIHDFFQNGVQTAVNVIFFLAAAAAIAYLVWAGIKYITAGGDPKKAEAARTAILNAVIGIAVIVGAYTLINLAFGINATVSEVTSSPQTFQ